MPKRIAFVRHEAFGDVLCTTPFLRLIQEDEPQASIELYSVQGKAIEGIPAFSRWISLLEVPMGKALPSKTYWFSYEHDPTLHILDGYECSTGLVLKDRSLQWEVPRETRQRLRESIGDRPRPWIGFSPTSHHHLRSLPPQKIQEVVDRLAGELGGTVFLTSERELPITGCVNFSARLGFPAEVGSLISLCDVWVTVDSAPLHLAQALGVRAVGLFGCTLPELRATKPSHLQVVRQESLTCLGCYHRLPPYAEVLASCERGDIACMTALEPEAVVLAARKALAGEACASLVDRIAEYERYRDQRLAGLPKGHAKVVADAYRRRISFYGRRLGFFKRLERRVRAFRGLALTWFRGQS